MYLKSLELHGFKSFADRTCLNFNGGINTIVGPNGCGKSNVIDAVRWVLGEQKYTALRSKSMDEVIFAGTSKRNPAGLASVTLTFDNSDGFFPIEEPEVTLCRRNYRDGAGQFLLNNKNVRLKDIHEMMADTGVGSGALFILSNQEIDRVLSPNSQERRAILEETAGINKYQIRKKETLKKLENTRENVSRLNDILQEVARQVEASEAQLKKLARYRNVKEKLIKTEIQLVGADLQAFQQKQNETEEKLKALDNERKMLQKKMDDVDQEMRNLEAERKKCLLETEAEKESLSVATLEDEKIRSSIELTDEKIRQSNATLSEYNRNLEHLNVRITGIEERLKKSTLEIKETEGSIEEAQEIYREKLDEYKSREGALAQVRRKIEADRRQLSAVLEKLKMITLEKEHVSSMLKSALMEKERHAERSSKMKAQLNETAKRIKEWEAKLGEIAAQKEKISREKAESEEVFNKISKEVKDCISSVASLKESLRALRSELSNLIREEEDFRGFSPAFQAIMKNKDKLPPMTPVHQVIKVDRQYETAIDVVLGTHFQSIITGTKEDANKFVEFLKKERAGRLTFFPEDLDRSSSPLPEPPKGSPGVISWAKDLIKTEPRYADIINVISGKTLVVKDLDCAYKLYNLRKKNHDFIPRMVTLEGDVVDFSGAVTGGRYRTDRSHLLARSRRRGEVEESIEKETQMLAAGENKLARLKESYSEEEKKYNSLQKKLLQIEREEQDTIGQVKLLQSMLSNAEADAAGLEPAGSEIEEKIMLHQSKLDEILAKINSLSREAEEKKQSLSKTEEENSVNLEGLEILKTKVEEAFKTLESLENKKQVLESDVKNDKRYLEENIRDKASVEEKIKLKQEELKSLDIERRELQNKASILKLRLNSLKAALNSSQEALQQTEEKMEEIRKRKSSVIIEDKAIEERKNNLRIEKIEIESRLSILDERFQEFPPELRKSVKDFSRPREELVSELERNRLKLNSFEGVNFSAEEEYNRHKERYDYLNKQIEDLNEASRGLKEIIKEMDGVSLKALEDTLTLLNERFSELFKKVFGGGKARVFFSNPENKLESGIEVEVQPPGKRTTSISLLSSGEKSLTAVTFLFALLSIKPGPFVMLDELDAPLDEANVEKIATLVKDFSQKSQFIVVTHNRKTMEFSDTMVGITMEEPGISRVVSVRFEDIEKYSATEVR